VRRRVRVHNAGRKETKDAPCNGDVAGGVEGGQGVKLCVGRASVEDLDGAACLHEGVGERLCAQRLCLTPVELTKAIGHEKDRLRSLIVCAQCGTRELEYARAVHIVTTAIPEEAGAVDDASATSHSAPT
jgi:hypothetical protein